MLYRLRESVSYCQVDGCLIFLDLDEDRYFRLPSHLEKAFLAYLHGDGQPGVGVNDLARRNILTQIPDTEPRSSPSAITFPSRSALEHKSPKPKFDALALLEVFTTVCSTQLQLRNRRLKHIIAALVTYRQHRTAHSLSTPDEIPVDILLRSASTFRRTRRYVPIETSCLLDSVALVRFLARRRLFANLVFGVTHNPFAAHCWVQAGDWVLNDTVGNIVAHTPIREV